jgi:hypothetical protein
MFLRLFSLKEKALFKDGKKTGMGGKKHTCFFLLIKRAPIIFMEAPLYGQGPPGSFYKGPLLGLHDYTT